MIKAPDRRAERHKTQDAGLKRCIFKFGCFTNTIELTFYSKNLIKKQLEIR
ncbi:hypothetical protein LX97_01423 [Nonlabens dokdonensis]|jgi:hypothetical protein|uniref:Uncharacterized protein n=1 Tax=Nonlabens dokdonensis TaxID=328515 RepID=A0ABX5Q3D9_9FLAO|nr:hypothetical protein LX97_01423 [Nonlabens dokdonensis]